MIEFDGSVFVGGTWQNGFGLRFDVQPDGAVMASFTFDALKVGPPGIVHGGALAAVLDEAMTAAVFASGKPAFTVHLDVNYRQPVSVNLPVTIVGRLDREEGRKLYLSARILLPDGSAAVESSALFITTPAFPAESAKDAD